MFEKPFAASFNKLAEKLPIKAIKINPIVNFAFSKEAPSTFLHPFKCKIEKNGDIITKSSEQSRTHIMNQASWITNLPENLRKKFPIIYKWNFDKAPYFYSMKNYPFPTLKKIIYDGNLADAIKFQRKIINFMFENFYTKSINLPETDFLEQNYLQKLFNRINSAKGLSQTFDKISDAEFLIINNKPCRGYKSILKDIFTNSSFLAGLEPKDITLYHGDFKFDNFLIDEKSNDFILIDPRGKSASDQDGSDYIEDMGKFSTSCHGYYDFFRYGECKREINTEQGAVKIKYSFLFPDIARSFDNCNIEFLKQLKEFDKTKNDENWEKRLYFAESMLILANAPFQMTGTPEDEFFSVNLLIRGIELLNDFIKKYPLNGAEKMILENINTPDDLARVKGIFRRV
jgi:hypothetical protein